jgi:hypothetical protein
MIAYGLFTEIIHVLEKLKNTKMAGGDGGSAAAPLRPRSARSGPPASALKSRWGKCKARAFF